MAPLLGGTNDLAEAVADTHARHVILAFASEPDHRLLEIVKQCEKLSIEVSLVPRMFEAINDRAILDHVGGLPVVSLRPTNPRGWQFAVKHALDRILALVALVALAPLLVLIALLVRLSSPGPVLFRQTRIGRDGQVSADADAATPSASAAARKAMRCTGRSSIGAEEPSSKSRAGLRRRISDVCRAGETRGAAR